MELRRTPRAPIDVLVEFAIKGNEETRMGGRAKDISLGGMFVETPEVAPFGAEVVIITTLPGQPAPFTLPGVVRWTRTDGMGVQFRMLGVRETHAITEVVRDSEGSKSSSDGGAMAAARARARAAPDVRPHRRSVASSSPSASWGCSACSPSSSPGRRTMPRRWAAAQIVVIAPGRDGRERERRSRAWWRGVDALTVDAQGRPDARYTPSEWSPARTTMHGPFMGGTRTRGARRPRRPAVHAVSSSGSWRGSTRLAVGWRRA